MLQCLPKEPSAHVVASLGASWLPQGVPGSGKHRAAQGKWGIGLRTAWSFTCSLESPRAWRGASEHPQRDRGAVRAA